MTKLMIWGIGGRMGQALSTMVRNDETCELVCGVDKFASPPDFKFKVYNDYRACKEVPDALIDFSRPDALEDILSFGRAKNTPLVLATTGYAEQDLVKIYAYAETAPVFMSANMSLGVNLLLDLARRAAAFLGEDFDVEIVEKHHNQKVDAPSGTALMLAKAVDEAEGGGMRYVYGRHGMSEKRKKRDIGIHALRGGSIVGEHDVIFAGSREVVTLSHSATSKEVFAAGAIAAAKFISRKKPGMYSMPDMLKEIEG